MPYVDFTYYSTTFGGTIIPETSFLKFEREARISINTFTFNRLKSDNTLIDDEVKECLCVMMECLYNIFQKELNADDGTGKLIASESVDGHNITYAISDEEKNMIDKSKATDIKLYNIAKKYLFDTGLLYRGL